MSCARVRVAAVLAVGSLLLAGCGSDKSSGGGKTTGNGSTVSTSASTSESTSASTSTEPATTAGGGVGAGGAVTTDQVEARLRKDPQIAGLEPQLKGKPGVYDTYIACVAKVIAKDADPSKLKDYVDGKADLSNLGNKAQGEQADADAEQCITEAVG